MEQKTEVTKEVMYLVRIQLLEDSGEPGGSPLHLYIHAHPRTIDDRYIFTMYETYAEFYSDEALLTSVYHQAKEMFPDCQVEAIQVTLTKTTLTAITIEPKYDSSENDT